MKRILTLLLVCASAGIFAQGKVAERVNSLKSLKADFKHFAILTPQSGSIDPNVEKVVTQSTLATIRTQSVNDIVLNQYETIEVEIPYQNETILVELFKADLYNEYFHLDTDQRKNVAYKKGVHYRGIVKGDETSIVSMNFFENEVNGIVSDYRLNNLVIGKRDLPGNTNQYIVYSDAKMLVENSFGCNLKDDDTHQEIEVPEASQRLSVASARCVTMYFELDYNLFALNGSNTTTATNWMSSVFNNVQTIYANADISISLRNVYIWTTPDPFTGNSSSSRMNQFNQQRPVFDGDVGQFLGVDPGSLGGVAAMVNGLCSQSNYCYADVDFSFASVPIYSWTVEVISHEMGHLLGSPHTHSCVWNGNNTAIDNCGSVAIPGGDGTACKTVPPTIPSTTVKGSIMSYCHLIAGVGINLNNGFGPQPAARILAAINASQCLSTDCTSTCINTAANITVGNVTGTSATINWSDLGTVSNWSVSVSTMYGSMVWNSTATESYNVTGLTPNTYYKVRIKPSCGSMNTFYRELIFATAANWCNGVTISDAGGPTANYGNNQRFTRVMIPGDVNKKLKLTFTVMDMESGFDFVYLYDGSSTSAPDISNGGFTGNVNPGTFISTAADGAMTLRFHSDLGMSDTGFVANVACEAKLGTGEFSQNVDFTYYPNPANDVVNILSQTNMTQLEVYNVAGQLLMSKKLNAMDTQVDISGFASGTYFFKLRFDEIEANFKILKL